MIHFTLSAYQYRLRMVVIILAAISPFICILIHGYKPSISSYWDTSLQPLFIITNAATSYYLFSLKNWKLSALMLLLLTAFSLTLYPGMHNVIAVIFFIANLYPLFKSNKFRWCFWIYTTALIALPFSMTISEIIAIDSLCIYHVMLLNKAYHITKE
jgi:hypothetical protein